MRFSRLMFSKRINMELHYHFIYPLMDLILYIFESLAFARRLIDFSFIFHTEKNELLDIVIVILEIVIVILDIVILEIVIYWI